MGPVGNRDALNVCVCVCVFLRRSIISMWPGCVCVCVCVRVCGSSPTFGQGAGDEDPPEGGDIGEVRVAPYGGVEVALQGLGVHNPPVVGHVDGATSWVCQTK